MGGFVLDIELDQIDKTDKLETLSDYSSRRQSCNCFTFDIALVAKMSCIVAKSEKT